MNETTVEQKRKGVEEYLRGWIQLAGDRPSLARLIVERGQFFTPAARPKGLRKQRNRECFKNAFHLARDTNLTYCEGYAAGVIPVLHAWCVNKDGVVIDPTWKETENAAYYGIAFDTDFVTRTFVKNRVYGLLASPETVMALAAADVASYGAKIVLPGERIKI